MEDMHCFSFIMVYELSSNKVLYSTSNQFLYVNKSLLHFLNIEQQFSFVCWFLCLSRVSIGQYWKKWNKKNLKDKEISRPYSWLSIEEGCKSSAHYAMNYSVVGQIRYVWHNFFISFFLLSDILLHFHWFLVHYLVNSFSHLMLTAGHWECCNKVGLLSRAECLLWFELRILWFDHSTLTQ